MVRKSNFKYILLMATGIILLFLAFSGALLAATGGEVKFIVGQKNYTIDGKVYAMDAETFIENSRTYVPVRYLAEALGASVEWEEATKMVTLTKEGVAVKLVIDQKAITVNGKIQDMDVAPLIKANRTYLPGRYVAEAFGCQVSWDEKTRAVSVFKTKPEEGSKESEGYYKELGDKQFGLGNYKEAIAYYSKAIELNPNYAKAYNNRGITYDELGQYDKGIADYNKAIELDPKYAEAYYNQAYAYSKLGQTERAISDLKKVLEIDPNYGDAKKGLKELGVPGY